MKITIRVEITTDWDETDTFEICQLERPYRQLEPEKVGLSLAEGKDLLHRLQKVVVAGGYGLRHRALSHCPDYLLSVREAVADGVSVQSDDRIHSGAGDRGTTIA
ncbi:hypothetical protein PPGU19_100050 (plasmid) [Paraburkholderia sp. PGU19]|nr:hypothetical protein PPGU19_100050 [Paraburkholderia sp. PGU19]